MVRIRKVKHFSKRYLCIGLVVDFRNQMTPKSNIATYSSVLVT